jgi:superfamily II DNA or RNA helicase
MSDFLEILQRLDSGSAEKGKAFEHALKWWLSNDPTWSKVFSPEGIHLWNESPHRKGPDTGIDLTAVDRFGKVWAIQAKNWDPTTSLPKSEIDSFLSASSTPIYSSRLLVTTTRTISANARRTIHEQEKPCVVLTFDNLADSPVWPYFESAAEGRREPIEQVLFDYQEEAVSEVVGAFTGGATKGQLIMACGTGKTLVSQRISDGLGAKRILVLLPSLLLVQQTLQSWLRNAPSSLKFLAVCSDVSVTTDAPRESVDDLPFSVTTQPKEIASFLEMKGTSVIFSTYQSSHQIALALKSCKVEFDLVIADEAHRLAGPIDSAYSTVLDPIKIRSQRTLFMTATPKIYSSTLAAQAAEADIEVASMDDEGVFGQVLFSYSFARAIREQRLMDYEVVIFGVSDSELWSDLEVRRLADLDGAKFDLKLLAAHIGLARAMDKYKIHRVISFHSRVSAATKFANAHPIVREKFLKESKGAGLCLSKVLTGEDSTYVRKQVLQELAQIEIGHFGLVTNARCLTEGIDVPSLDGVAFIDPKASQIDIVQALGRAIRRSGPHKVKGYIVVPIFLSAEEIESGEMGRTNFKHVFEVLNGLKAHDEAFTERVTDLRTELGRTGKLYEGIPKLQLDLPKKVKSEIFSKIHVLLLKNVTAAWEEWYGKLLAHFELSGSLRINQSSNETDDERALSGWVTKQRGAFRLGRLSPDRVEKLEKLPGWTWDPFEASWSDAYEQLKNFAKAEGHCRVSREEKNLYSWISSQRRGRSQLVDTKVEALESLPGWTWDALDAQWRANFEALTELTSEMGTSDVPAKTIYKNVKVGQWIGWMRRKYQESELSKDQIEQLEKLPGWKWDPLESTWQEVFSLVREISETQDLTKFEKRSEYKGLKIGQWIGLQRRRRESLSQTRRDQLESLKGWTWDPKDNFWKKNYDLVLKVAQRDGADSISFNAVVDGVRIGQWIGVQRRSREEMSEERRAALESVPGWTWSVLEEKRSKVLKSLRDFSERNGHLELPAAMKVDGINLYAYKNRLRKSKAKLSPAEREALEAIQGWSWLDPS